MDKKLADLKVLIDNETLIKRIKELASEINRNYNNSEPLILLCVLKGAVMFYTELAKHLKMPVIMEFVSISSYGNSETSSGEIKVNNLNFGDLDKKNVLIVEDIIDTGLTLDYLIKYIKNNTKAKSVKLAVLLDKKCKKSIRKCNIEAEFTAFDIDDKFIVGFGLDYCFLYRNLDYIGYFE